MRIVAAGITVIAISYLFALPQLFNWLMPLADSYKILISITLIAPLACLMGMPFPLGLRQLARHAPDWIPWAWGVNGCASVVSAVFATIMAIHGGFKLVILLALVLYGLAAWSAYWPKCKNKDAWKKPKKAWTPTAQKAGEKSLDTHRSKSRQKAGTPTARAESRHAKAGNPTTCKFPAHK